MAIRSKSANSAPEQRPIFSGLNQNTNAERSEQGAKRAMPTPCKRRPHRGKLGSLLLAGAAAVVLTGTTGCSLVSNAYKQLKKHEYLDEFLISHRNSVFAAKAWYREKHCFEHNQNIHEFKQGFMDGYMDVANGSSGCVPCVAPSQYWGWRYQSPGGKQAIDAWFAGYPLGVKAAEQDGVGHWSMLQTMPKHTAVANPAPEASPMPTEVIYGPDGQPIDIQGEVIVPGSARVIESPTPSSTTLPPQAQNSQLFDTSELGSPEFSGPSFNAASNASPADTGGALEQASISTDVLFGQPESDQSQRGNSVVDFTMEDSADSGVSHTFTDSENGGAAEIQSASQADIPFKFE